MITIQRSTMMKHELPIHQRDPKPSRKVHDNDRLLPSGVKVDFGKGPEKRKKEKKEGGDRPKQTNNKAKSDKAKKSEKFKEPLLPNGLKPDFGNTLASPKDIADKSKRREKKSSGQSLPSGAKPNFGGELKVDSPTYAGSSFHSSPQALNLPKPSFKKDDGSNGSNSNSSNSNGSNSPPTSSSSSTTTTTPPQFPVTAYPPGSVAPNYNYYMNPQQQQQAQQLPPQRQFQVPPPQFQPPQQYHQPPGVFPGGPPQPFIQPGFAYQVNPQGYIQYPPPSGYLAQPIISHYQQPASVQGEKISFNQLLGKSNN